MKRMTAKYKKVFLVLLTTLTLVLGQIPIGAIAEAAQGDQNANAEQTEQVDKGGETGKTENQTPATDQTQQGQDKAPAANDPDEGKEGDGTADTGKKGGLMAASDTGQTRGGDAEMVTVSVTPKNKADFSPAYGAGSITINGQKTESLSVEKGSTVTLEATPASGWEFVNWYIGTSLTDNPHTFTAMGTTNVTAYFQATETYTVTLDGNGHGGTLGTLEVPKGSSISSTYADTWYKGGTEFDTFYKTLTDGGKTYRVDHYATSDLSDFTADTTVNGDITVYAQWNEQIDSASITFTAPDAGTAVTSAKTDWGATQFPTPSVSVPSGAHYAFGQDDDYPNGTSLYLSSLPSGDPRDDLLKGTMTAGETYYFNSWLVADDGYFFADDFQLTVNGATLCEADLTGADGKGVDVYASFEPAAASEPVEVYLTVNNLLYGSMKATYTDAEGNSYTDTPVVSGETLYVQEGTDVTVTAVPSSDYSLQGWYDFSQSTKGALLAMIPSYTFTANSNTKILAEFESAEANTYTCSFSTNNANLGMVAIEYTDPSDTPQTIELTEAAAFQIKKGSEVKIWPVVSDTCMFVGWYDYSAGTLGDLVSTYGAYSFTPESNTSLQGVFTEEYVSYNVRVTNDRAGTVSATYDNLQGTTSTQSQGQLFVISTKFGGQVSLTAQPRNDNYSFLGWYAYPKGHEEESTLVSSSPTYNFTAPETRSMTIIKAEFEERVAAEFGTGCTDGATYSVTTPAGTQSGLSGFGVSNQMTGDEITLTADSLEGYAFEGWYKATKNDPNDQYYENVTDELVASDKTFTFNLSSLNKDTGYYAKYVPIYNIKTGKIGNGSYTISVDGTQIEGGPFTQKNFDACEGEQVTLVATPESGSTFVGWWPGWVNPTSGLVTNARANLTTISMEPTLTFAASEPDYVVENAYCAVFATSDQLLDTVDVKAAALYEGVNTPPDVTYNGSGDPPYQINPSLIFPAGSDVPLSGDNKTVAGQQYDILLTCSANTGYMWSQGENAITYDIENGSLVEGSPNVRLSSINFKIRVTAQQEGHSITVAGGTADKQRANAGEQVTLTAVAPDWPQGNTPVFAEWNIKAASASATPVGYTASTVTITMPDDDITAIACYDVWYDATTDDSTVVFDGNLTMTDTARNTETFDGDVFDKTINVHYTRTAEDNANITTQVNAMRDALATKAQEIYYANNGCDYGSYDTNSISNETTWDHRRYTTVEYNMDGEVAPETGTWEKTTPMIKQHNATGGYGKSQTYKTDRDGTYKGLVSLGVGGSEGGTFSVAPTSGSDQYFSGGEGTANYYLVYNTSVTATATPATGYNFVGWYTGTYTDGFVKGHTDTLLSQNPTYTFNATADDTPIYALFEADAPILTIDCSAGINVGSMFSSVTVNGTPLTMSDPPDTGLIYSNSTKMGSVDIAAGTPVTVVVTPTANAVVMGYTTPTTASSSPVAYSASTSAAGVLTMSFTMPGENVSFGASLAPAVTVTYDINGGTPGTGWPADNSIKMDMSTATRGIPVQASNFERFAEPPAGCSYAGVEITYDGGTVTLAPDQGLANATFRNGGNIKWLWEGGKTLHFDANGGDGEMADVTVAEGAEYSLPDCSFDANWKVFDHWEVTVGDGQPMSKQPGETVVMSDDAVAKAVWKDAAMLVISLVGNGYEDSAWNHATVTLDGVEVAKPETGPAAGIKIAVGSSHTVVITPANGYAVTLAGLGDEDIAPDADGKATIEIPEVQSTGLIISGAEVEPVYTVSFDTNGANPSEMAAQKVAYGGHAKEPSVETNETAPVKGNLVLRGWYKDVSLTEPFDFAEDTIETDITLYAGWDVPVKLDVVNLDSDIVNGTGGSATITYDDVTVTAPTQDFVYLPEGKTVTLTATPDTDGHFAFNSWRTGSSADSPAVVTVPEGKYGNETCNVYVNQFLDSATIHALFELETCTVTFNAHNGETTHATQQVKYGQYATKLTPDPERTAARPGNPDYHPVLNTWQTVEGSHDSAFNFRNTPVTSDIELHAEWGFTMEATGYNMVTGAVADNSGGKLSWNDSTYTDSAASYSPEGTELTVYSKPDDDYIFRGWAYGDNKDQMLSDNPVYTANIEEMPERFYALFDYPHVNFDAGEHGTKGTGWVDYISTPKGEVFGTDQTAVNMIDHFLDDDIIVPEEGYRPVGLKITPSEGDPITLGLDDEIDYQVDADVTVEVLWATSPVTLHFSSVYGDDLVAPISFNVADPDTGIGDAINAHFGTDEDFGYEPFELAGYEDYGYRMPKPMSEYSSTDDLLYNHLTVSDKVGEDGMDVYYTMYKVVDAVELSYDSAPICGTSTTTDENTQSILRWDWETQTNPPAASTSGETYSIDDYEGVPDSFWTLSRDEDTPYIGDFEGGRQYLANTSLKANYGYVFADEVSATVNGAELVEAVPDCIRVYVYSMLTAAHVPGDPVRENEIAPTCTEPGSYDMVTYCTECSAPISATQAVIQPLGHDWGEWKVVKEPTTSSAGIEERTCSRCEAKEACDIPALDGTYKFVEGDGAVWDKGSSDGLTFRIKRTEADELSFDRFTELKVDGNDVPVLAYDKQRGSVIVTLKPFFLYGLDEGEHTIQARFDDSTDGASATFTVKAASSSAGSDKYNYAKARYSSVKTGDVVGVGIAVTVGVALAALGAMMIASRRRRDNDK